MYIDKSFLKKKKIPYLIYNLRIKFIFKHFLSKPISKIIERLPFLRIFLNPTLKDNNIIVLYTAKIGKFCIYLN